MRKISSFAVAAAAGRDWVGSMGGLDHQWRCGPLDKS